MSTDRETCLLAVLALALVVAACAYGAWLIG
jgi:hypothetical protein